MTRSASGRPGDGQAANIILAVRGSSSQCVCLSIFLNSLLETY